ncbi:MAG: hypothetical protein JWQ34_3168 [Mucilaginibacter sp.]|nr:hypothetical protein [Mucilaginibacter sp.]
MYLLLQTFNHNVRYVENDDRCQFAFFRYYCNLGLTLNQ